MSVLRPIALSLIVVFMTVATSSNCSGEPDFWPIRTIVPDTLAKWDARHLKDAPKGSVVAVITPLTDDCTPTHRLFIDVAPIETLRERIVATVQRSLNPANEQDRLAFEAMVDHLKDSEFFPDDIGEKELTQLRQMFKNRKITTDGLYIVGRGYEPALEKEVDKLPKQGEVHRYALRWAN